MCRKCEIAEEVKSLKEEIDLRVAQYQMEIRAGRDQAAESCRERTMSCMDQVFGLLTEFHSADSPRH